MHDEMFWKQLSPVLSQHRKNVILIPTQPESIKKMNIGSDAEQCDLYVGCIIFLYWRCQTSIDSCKTFILNIAKVMSNNSSLYRILLTRYKSNWDKSRSNRIIGMKFWKILITVFHRRCKDWTSWRMVLCMSSTRTCFERFLKINPFFPNSRMEYLSVWDVHFFFTFLFIS